MREALAQGLAPGIEVGRRLAGELHVGLEAVRDAVARAHDHGHELDARLVLDGALHLAELDAKAVHLNLVVNAARDPEPALGVHVAEVARAIRAHHAAVQLALAERGRRLVRAVEVALGYRVAADEDLAALALPHRLTRLAVEHEQRRARARHAHGELLGVGAHRDRHGRDRHGRLGGAVGVDDGGVREALRKAAHHVGAKRLAAEEEVRERGHHGVAEGGLGEADRGEGGRRDPAGGLRGGQRVEELARVLRHVGREGHDAPAGRERANELCHRKVEGEQRLVEEDVRLGGIGKERLVPRHEVGHVCGRDLDALGRARGARGEDDVLRLVTRDLPGRVRAPHDAAARRLEAGRELAASDGLHLAAEFQEVRQLAHRKRGRRGKLGEDTRHAPGRHVRVARYVGVPALEAGQKAHRHERRLVAVDEQGRAARRTLAALAQAAGELVGRVPELAVGERAAARVSPALAPGVGLGLRVDGGEEAVLVSHANNLLVKMGAWGKRQSGPSPAGHAAGRMR